METFADIYSITEQRSVNIGPYKEGWIRDIFVNAIGSGGQVVRERVEVDELVEKIFDSNRFSRVSSIEILKERAPSLPNSSASTSVVTTATDTTRAPKKSKTNATTKDKPKKSTGTVSKKAGSKASSPVVSVPPSPIPAVMPMPPSEVQDMTGGVSITAEIGEKKKKQFIKRYHFDEADVRLFTLQQRNSSFPIYFFYFPALYTIFFSSICVSVLHRIVTFFPCAHYVSSF
jgi:hypothetical protein